MSESECPHCFTWLGEPRVVYVRGTEGERVATKSPGYDATAHRCNHERLTERQCALGREVLEYGTLAKVFRASDIQRAGAAFVETNSSSVVYAEPWLALALTTMAWAVQLARTPTKGAERVELHKDVVRIICDGLAHMPRDVREAVMVVAALHPEGEARHLALSHLLHDAIKQRDLQRWRETYGD